MENPNPLDLHCESIAFKAEQTIELAKVDLDFLAGLVMPNHFLYLFPDMYKQIWIWLLSYADKQREFPQLALGLPRGFAKSTFIKLFIVYLILYTNKKFILILGETETKAENILSDVMDMLSESNIVKIFGSWKLGAETDRTSLKKFGFRGRNIILAASTVKAVRGLNLKNERPDIMLFDDIQSKECSQSETQSTNLYSEMVGTAMKAKSPHGCMFLFLANMYPTDNSILKKLKSNPNWLKFIAGGLVLNEQTGEIESLWEELQPKRQLIAEFINDAKAGKPEVFFAEVLNDENVSLNTRIDISKLPKNPYAEETIHQGNFIVIDPSGNKKNSDATAIGYFEIFDGKPVLQKLIAERLSPGDTIKKALQLALANKCRIIGIESIAYQASLHYWFEFICLQLGIEGINTIELYRNRHSKNSAIISMFDSLKAGELYYSDETSPQVAHQILCFNPARTDNTDDILDLLVYCLVMVSNHYHTIASSCILEEQEFLGIPVIEYNSPF